MPALFDRRSLFVGAAACALAACTGTRQRARPAVGRRIAVSNHAFYIDADTNPGFTAATGITVDYHEDVVDGVLPAHRDVVVTDEHDALAIAATGGLHAIDRGAVPNVTHVSVPVRDPSTTVPWAQGIVGIAYDRRALGRDVRAIAELFRSDLHGRVALADDRRATLGVAMLADGIDPAAATVDDAVATAALVGNSVALGQVVVARSPVQALLAGDVDVVVTRASDTVGLEASRPDVVFVVPDEGGMLVTDVLVVPRDAADADGAFAYVDYVCDPAHAAARFRSLPVVWTIDGVEPRLSHDAPDVVADPRRNPPAALRARLHTFAFLDDRDEQQVAAAFDAAVRVPR